MADVTPPPRPALIFLTAVARLENRIRELESTLEHYDENALEWDPDEHDWVTVPPRHRVERQLDLLRIELRDLRRSATGGELLPVSVVAEQLGIPAARIRKWIERGKLLAFPDPDQRSASTHEWPEPPNHPKVRRLVYINEVKALIKPT